MKAQPNPRPTTLPQAEMVATARRERMLTTALFEVRLQPVIRRQVAVR